MIDAFEQSLGAATLLAGLLLLRSAWRAASGRRAARTAAGWGLIVGGMVLWGLTAGADLAIGLAALTGSLIAYFVVAATVRIRTRRTRSVEERTAAEDPVARPRRPGRLVARIVLAGPLSLAFGVAVCLALAVRAPVAPVDGVVLGGLVGPLAIAAAMGWSLIDSNLSRVAIGIGASSLLLAVACQI